MMDLTRLAGGRLQITPFAWASINNLFSRIDCIELANSFPRDNFKTVASYGGRKTMNTKRELSFL